MVYDLSKSLKLTHGFSVQDLAAAGQCFADGVNNGKKNKKNKNYTNKEKKSCKKRHIFKKLAF